MKTESSQALASLNGKQRRSRKRKLKQQQNRLRGKMLKKAIDAAREAQDEIEALKRRAKKDHEGEEQKE
jgi:hypothetical protein